MGLILYIFGIAITYFIIKFAVKSAINESLEDIKHTVKQSIVAGLTEYERKKQNE